MIVAINFLHHSISRKCSITYFMPSRFRFNLSSRKTRSYRSGEQMIPILSMASGRHQDILGFIFEPYIHDAQTKLKVQKLSTISIFAHDVITTNLPTYRRVKTHVCVCVCLRRTEDSF